MDSPVILISDDDEKTVRVLERQATMAGLWAVPDLSSEAVQLTALLHPAVIVLDVYQARHGLELLKEIKADPRNQDIDVVVISGSVEESIKSACLQAGASEFVSKPLDATFLVGVARRAAHVSSSRLRAQSQRKLGETRRVTH